MLRITDTDLKNVLYDNIYNNKKTVLKDKSVNNIIKYVENLNNISKEEKDYTHKEMKKRFEENYNKVSNSNKKYYVYNFLLKKDNKSGFVENSAIKNIGNFGDVFKFQDDFYFTNNVKSLDNLEQNDIKFKEKNAGEFLLNADKMYAYKKLSKVMYLEHIYKEKSKIFITFTLPGEYAKYKKRSVFFVKNKNYKGGPFGKVLEEGLNKLNDIHRFFYLSLKKSIERASSEKKEVGFIKMLEPHKNLTGHAHSLFYIDKEYIKIAEHVYNLTIKKFKLEQTKFELLKSAKSSTYVQKYLIKTTRSEERFFNEYKRYFSNIRFFTSSNFKHINQEKIDIIYKYLGKNRPLLIKQFKQSNKSLYYFLELLYKKEYFKFEEIEKECYVIDRIKLKSIHTEIAAKYKKEIDYYKKIWGADFVSSNYFKVYHNVLNLVEEDIKVKSRLEAIEKEITFKVLNQVYKCVKKIKNKQIQKVYFKDKEIYNIKDFEYLKTNIEDVFINL